jgi:hypothetical protein
MVDVLKEHILTLFGNAEDQEGKETTPLLPRHLIKNTGPDIEERIKASGHHLFQYFIFDDTASMSDCLVETAVSREVAEEAGIPLLNLVNYAGRRDAKSGKPPKPTTARIIPTSITLDYRMHAWGPRRMVLDGMSNHLPSDSHAKEVKVWLEQDSVLVPLAQADPAKKTTRVIMEDDGSGYSSSKLKKLQSDKAADVMSIGQFGEGLKLIATAGLRTGIGIEYQSRDWSARPFLAEDPEDEDEPKSEYLHFDVKIKDSITGSRTIFTNPNEEFMKEVFALPKSILAFNNDYEVLHKTHYFKPGTPYYLWLATPVYSDRIINLKDDQTVFVKQVAVSSMHGKQLFSYDLGIDQIHPDRAEANQKEIYWRVKNLLNTCKNRDVIDTILKTAQEQPELSCLEFSALGWEDDSPIGILSRREKKAALREMKNNSYAMKIYKIGEDAWETSFSRTYGENAVLPSSDYVKNEDAKIMGYTVVNLNKDVAKFLENRGIKTADDIKMDQEYRWIADDALTPDEKLLLETSRDIAKFTFGEKTDVRMRVYSGLFTKTGREIKESHGVNIQRAGGENFVGVKRSLLTNPREFALTCVHEFGHYKTKAGDGDRAFTDFFVETLVKKYEEARQKQSYDTYISLLAGADL